MGEAIYADLCSSLHVKKEPDITKLCDVILEGNSTGCLYTVYIYIYGFLSQPCCILRCEYVFVCLDGSCGLNWGHDF